MTSPSPEHQESNVIDITNRLPLDESDPRLQVRAIHAAREARRLELAEMGWSPEKVQHLLNREFLPKIARLAVHADITSLLDSETPSEPEPAGMTRWGRDTYAEHGKDDVRNRAAGDHD